jgi:hypothetical protein
MPDARPLEYTRDEDFVSLYANNTQFESTLWDLKLTFGQVDLANSKIEQHTSMVLPWPQAKLAAYYMLVNVTIHQANNGLIYIPPAVLPKRPDPSDPTIEGPHGKRLVEYLGWIHDQFFGSNPYVPPEVAKYDNLPEGNPEEVKP